MVLSDCLTTRRWSFLSLMVLVHVAVLGAVVSPLTRADDSTLRKIRKLLEDAIDE